MGDVQDQLISAADDRAVIVFDLSTQTPIQTLFRGSTQLGSRLLSTVHFNVRRQALLIATNVIGLLEHDASDPRLLGLVSHSQPVNIVIYNQLFHIVGQPSFIQHNHIFRHCCLIKLSPDRLTDTSLALL